MRKCIVAIDGPAGVGKSTVAKKVAQELNYFYVDSGAMYRAITWKVLNNKINLNSQSDIVRCAKNTTLRIKNNGTELTIFVDGIDVTDKIRDEKVTKWTCVIASIPAVRNILRKIQRQIGKENNVVMEGRDIGTKVFPKADFKFFLDASIDIRAKRRYKEIKGKSNNISLERIKRSISIRDKKDRTRHESPLVKAKDAILIDTSNITANKVAQYILSYIRCSKG